MEQLKFIAPGEKIFKHPDLIQDVLERKPRVPIHFELDLTNRCNLACDGCHFAYTHVAVGDHSQDIPMPLYRKIISDMEDNKVKAITYTGGGEPLFHPDHLEMFKIAQRAGLKMGMYTNGVLLEEETADFVAENFEWVYVSLDAANPQEFKDYKKRGLNVFNRNVRNIREFSTRPRKANIGVGYLIGPHNIATFKEAIPWLLDLGTDYVQTRPAIDVGTYQEQRETGQMSQVKDNWQEHYSWIPEARAILDTFSDPRLDTASKKFEDLYEGKRTYTTCLSTSLSGSIGATGEAWLCVNTRGIAPLGNLNTLTLQEIYGKKSIEVCDLTKCRIMCRNDQLNQTLARIDSQLKHIEFI